MYDEIYVENIDKNLPVVIFTVGSSGQGKTTYSNNILIRRGDTITSPVIYHWDEFRSHFKIRNGNLSEHSKRISDKIIHDAFKDVNNGKDVVYDSLNSTNKYIKEFKSVISAECCNYIGIFFNKPIEQVLSNNKNKLHPFPDSMIKHMYRNEYNISENEFNFIIRITSNSEYDKHLIIIN